VLGYTHLFNVFGDGRDLLFTIHHKRCEETAPIPEGWAEFEKQSSKFMRKKIEGRCLGFLL